MGESPKGTAVGIPPPYLNYPDEDMNRKRDTFANCIEVLETFAAVFKQAWRGQIAKRYICQIYQSAGAFHCIGITVLVFLKYVSSWLQLYFPQHDKTYVLPVHF